MRPQPVDSGRTPEGPRVTIFTIWFQNFPNNLVILIGAAAMGSNQLSHLAK